MVNSVTVLGKTNYEIVSSVKATNLRTNVSSIGKYENQYFCIDDMVVDKHDTVVLDVDGNQRIIDIDNRNTIISDLTQTTVDSSITIVKDNVYTYTINGVGTLVMFIYVNTSGIVERSNREVLLDKVVRENSISVKFVTNGVYKLKCYVVNSNDMVTSYKEINLNIADINGAVVKEYIKVLEPQYYDPMYSIETHKKMSMRNDVMDLNLALDEMRYNSQNNEELRCNLVNVEAEANITNDSIDFNKV